MDKGRILLLSGLLTVVFVVVSLGLALSVTPPVINDVNVSPELDVALFTAYSAVADIELATDVNVTITGINGDGGTTIDYYSDGNTSATTRTFAMVNTAGNTWNYSYLYPDYLYPEIYFAPSTITWTNAHSDYPLWKNSYHIMHYSNPFTMEANMSFWIEFYAETKTGTNSVIQVYLVGNGNSISYFDSDWKTDTDTIQVGTVNKNTAYSHTHSANSSHYLVGLVPGATGLIDDVNVSSDFWIVLYCNSNTEARGWNLEYVSSTLQDNTNRWYLANGTTYATPTALHGAPDAHVHLARRGTNKDGLTTYISATGSGGDSNKSFVFYFNTPTNLAPSGIYFDSPDDGTYDATVAVDWTDATDPNGDTLTYTLSLIYPGGTTVALYSGTDTSYSLETGPYPNGIYDLQCVVSDGTASSTSLLSNQYGVGFEISHIGSGGVYDDDGEEEDDGIDDGWAPDDDEEEGDGWIFGDDHDGDGDYDRADFREDIVILIDIFGGYEAGEEPDDMEIDFIVDVLIDMFHCDDMWADVEVEDIPIAGGIITRIEEIIGLDVSRPFDWLYQALMHENTVNFYQFGHWKLRAWMYALFFGFIFFMLFGDRDEKKKRKNPWLKQVNKTIKRGKSMKITRMW